MRVQTVRVQLSEMDFELAENNSNKILKTLVENAHETISSMLRKHKSEIYKKDEKE